MNFPRFVWLSLLILIGCSIKEETTITCMVNNQSITDVTVEYKETTADSTTVVDVDSSDVINVFHNSFEGKISEPDKDEFRELGDYLKIFADDSLIIDETPLNKDNWVLTYSGQGAFMSEVTYSFHYVFYVTDSLITANMP